MHISHGSPFQFRPTANWRQRQCDGRIRRIQLALRLNARPVYGPNNLLLLIRDCIGCVCVCVVFFFLYSVFSFLFFRVLWMIIYIYMYLDSVSICACIGLSFQRRHDWWIGFDYFIFFFRFRDSTFIVCVSVFIPFLCFNWIYASCANHKHHRKFSARYLYSIAN